MITRAEALLAALATTLAALVVVAYGLDAAGLAFPPWPMLAIAAATMAAVTRASRPPATSPAGALLAPLAITAAVFAWVLWLARPSLLPIGSGPDLTHHLILVRQIEHTWRLVHDPSLEAYLGEMMYYTPGSHVLVALAGAWLGADGLQAFTPIVALCVALTCGFVFLIVQRLTSRRGPQVAAGVIAVASLFAAPRFFLGPFVEYSFLAQIVAELFAVAMWWALSAWDQTSARLPLVTFSLCGAALFLTWPVLIGPPVLALGLLLLLRPGAFRSRLPDSVLALVPLIACAANYLVGRLGWLQLAGTRGETAQLSIAAYGLPFIVLMAIGLAGAACRRRAHPTACMAAAFLLESAALYWMAARQGNPPYMALKLAYGFLYIQAAAVGLAVGEIAAGVARIYGDRNHHGDAAVDRSGASRDWVQAGAWLAAVACVLAAARSVSGAPRTLPLDYHPAVTRPLEDAGKWAAQNLPAGCVEYLVPDVETAYWLHLAILGNPRMSARTGNDDTYELKKTLVRWLTPDGLPYAIVDLAAIPSDVRLELDVIQPFGRAAVARRRGPSRCPPS